MHQSNAWAYLHSGHLLPYSKPTVSMSNLTFWTYKIFLSKFEVVVVGGCLVPDPPPPTTTTPKLQLDFLDLENFLVKV